MAYSPTDLVSWYGKITQQLLDKVAKSRELEDSAAVLKLEQFTRLWRQYPITGSVQIENVTPLQAAASVLAMDSWSEARYFLYLETALSRVLADLQRVPALDVPQKGTPGGSRKAMRPPSNFGPEMPKAGAAKPQAPTRSSQVQSEPSSTLPPVEVSTAPAKAGAEESVSGAARNVLRRRDGLLLAELRVTPALSTLAERGMLTYDAASDRFWPTNMPLLEALAADYDVGDQVTVTHQGKTITGVVSQRADVNGDCMVDFDPKDTAAPRQPAKFNKNQLRRKDNRDAPAVTPPASTAPSAQLRTFYGTGNNS